MARRASLAGRIIASKGLAKFLAAVSGNHVLTTEYPPSARNEPRWGHGRPPHERLHKIIARGDEHYRRVIKNLLVFLPELSGSQEPSLVNPWLGSLDCLSLFGFTRINRPAQYVEVGSGTSTRFVRSAIDSGALDTKITSIDPQPRAEIDDLCDEVRREPLEQVDLSLFGKLGKDDISFFDGSHRVFMNSDATVFFLDILPNLSPGVLVGIHDIHLPADYPPEAARVFPSEQYLLAAYLLAEGPYLQPLLPCRYIENSPSLNIPLAGPSRGQSSSVCFWLKKTS